MMLAVDAGNSRTKWGVFAVDGALRTQGAVDNVAVETLEATWRGCAGVRLAAVSCVGGAALANRLEVIFQALAWPVHWVASAPQACGVRNGYANPQQLGSDRWAALVAAWHRYHLPCVVATAGTALTVDALSAQGEFLGGLIVPGYGMMRGGLAAGTAAVSPVAGSLSDFPVTTADAVHSGALAALAGAVERMCARLAAHEGCTPLCLLSGGDAELLASALGRHAEVVPDLVLHGIYLMEKASK